MVCGKLKKNVNDQHNPNSFLPSLSSPKLPQPIFLPTLKFGPTMSTPEEPEDPEAREWPLRPWPALLLRAGRSASFSRAGSMAQWVR